MKQFDRDNLILAVLTGIISGVAIDFMFRPWLETQYKRRFK